MSETLEQAFSRYGRTLIEGNHQSTIEFIPKERSAASLKAAQNNPSVKKILIE